MASGIWFFGLSGAGKTYASKIAATHIDNAFLVDGDVVRKFVTPNAGYSATDRKNQLKLVFGLAKLVLENGYFPIISTVTMNEDIFACCLDLDIRILEIKRSKEQREAAKDIYRNSKNVVGKDIEVTEMNTDSIYNSGTPSFVSDVERYTERYILKEL